LITPRRTSKALHIYIFNENNIRKHISKTQSEKQKHISKTQSEKQKHISKTQSEKQKQFQVTDYITTSKIKQQNSTQK
jgi:hypothetical protein